MFFQKHTLCHRPLICSRQLSLLLVFIALLHSAQVRGITLTIVTELSPPEQTPINGELSGPTTEIVKAALVRASVNANFEIYPWSRAYSKAVSTPNTLIYAMAKTKERLPLFDWIGPVGHYELGFVRLTKNKRVSIAKLEDAFDYTIAVQRSDISYDFLLEQGFEKGRQLLITADITQSWELLMKEKVDLVIDDHESILIQLKQLSLPSDTLTFEYKIPQLSQTTYLAANPETDKKLLKRLRNAFNQTP